MSIVCISFSVRNSLPIIIVFDFINSILSIIIFMWEVSRFELLFRLYFYKISVINNISSVILPKCFFRFLSKIHIWFVFCKIITISNNFIMERFRFCFIRYYFKIVKYLMNRRIIYYNYFKLKWVSFTIPICRFYIICYINYASLTVFPEICR
jgi:hypothetical protein